MKIDAFITLDAVLQGHSFAAAAAHMNLTPSAVSMQMKQLELYLGQTLFDRSGLQVRPTPLAHEVADAMRDGLHRIAAMRRRSSLDVGGVVKLGVIESMLPVLLSGTIRRLRDRYPKLDIRPVRGRSAGLTESVKAGTLDAAVVAQPPKGGLAGLRWVFLESRELVLIAPPDSTETSIDALFRRYEWIRYDRNTVTGGMAVRYVNATVKHRRPGVEIDSAAAIVSMVSAGLGVSIVQLSDPSTTLAFPVRLIRLGPSAPILRISLVTRKADKDDRRLLALKEAMDDTLLARRSSMAELPARG
jgi:DNA-binding transcriptional LysR family regulator